MLVRKFDEGYITKAEHLPIAGFTYQFLVLLN